MGKHLGIAYNLRLPQELKDKIAQSAKELNRSMNADIVARLEDSFTASNTQLRENETIIDKDLLNELLSMKAELSKISKIIEKEFNYPENYELGLGEPDIPSSVELPLVTVKDTEEDNIDMGEKKA
ncbi:Arc family DNA-binding protein [Acinetobacter baumannii]|uniref:Arc family DNA-binding protein n=1 Tax=Acinetobacter baumannii TaxID=470 RepID=UPI00209BA114|nr:Arc family DNA-binding protein [Acinetobacter baumannii]MDC4508855.1 Arc family DNA-binding protein [Acinetobacter baumannii]MDC4828772.1 Arc family DNA-binding protein [Acinetobacter baumannii]MDN8272756.1 Arc family DNA-binding protein [Acinetobacter baumannii]